MQKLKVTSNEFSVLCAISQHDNEEKQKHKVTGNKLSLLCAALLEKPQSRCVDIHSTLQCDAIWSDYKSAGNAKHGRPNAGRAKSSQHRSREYCAPVCPEPTWQVALRSMIMAVMAQFMLSCPNLRVQHLPRPFSSSCKATLLEEGPNLHRLPCRRYHRVPEPHGR